MNLKKLGTVVLFLFVAFLLVQLMTKAGDVINYIALGCWIVSFILIGIYVAYLFKHRKDLFSCLLIAVLCFSTVNAYADIDDKEVTAYMQKQVDGYGREVCAAIGSAQGGETKEFHQDAGGTYQYSEELTAKAEEIVEFYKKSANSEAAGLSKGQSSLRCAERYLQYVGQLKQTSKESCSPVKLLMQNVFEKKSCWPCDITALVLNSIQSISVAAYSVVNSAALGLLGVMYAFWLVITILVMISKFSFERFSEVFTRILHQTILVIIIAVILNGPIVSVYKYVVSPFVTYTTSLTMYFSAFGQEAIGKGTIAEKAISALGIKSSAKCDYCDKMGAAFAVDDVITVGQFMDSRSINSVLCLVCTVYRQFAPMISLGQTMTCLSTAAPKVAQTLPILSSIPMLTSPNLPLLLTGYFLVVVFTILMLIVGLTVMSAVMRLGFVLVLMPLFLVAFAFKFSRGYAKRGWHVIMQAMVTLMALSLTISLMLIGFNSLLPDASLSSFLSIFQSSGPSVIMNMLSPTEPEGESGMLDMMNQAQNAPPLATLMLMLGYASISMSVIGSSSQLAERIIGEWMNVSEDMQEITRVLGDSMQTGMGATKATASIIGAGAGAINKKYREAKEKVNLANIEQSYRKKREQEEREDQAQQNNRSG